MGGDGPTNDPMSDAVARLLSRLDRVVARSDGWSARCPAHEDTDPSLSVKRGSNGRVLLLCRVGCRTEDVVAALGLTMADLFEHPEAEPRISATYAYRDEGGGLLYQVCRFEPKDFRARRPGGAGGWIWNLRGVRRVLYRLPELLAAPAGSTVFTVEGEKDADRLAALGLVATTNAGGAGKWRPEDGAFLRGQEVVILPDNDGPGRKHAQAVAASLAGIAARVRILALPGLPPKGDVADWLDAGGTEDELGRLILADDPDEDSADRWTADWSADDQPVAGPRRSQASMLIELASDAEIFHTPTEEPFATVEVDAHRETHPIRSRAFGAWLRRRYWDACQKPVGGSAMSDAIEMLAARALFGGATLPVGVRIARLDDCVYVDLANDAWEVVEVGPSGWRVVTDSRVRFRRPATMDALPAPLQGGSLDALRPFVNLADDDGWHLFVGTLMAAYRAAGPYLILILHGEQGSAKSTTARLVRALVDPSRSPLRTEPREVQDLLIAARNNWVVAFDNVSHLQPWLSDALCRLSTGGGLGKRQLYTDQDEIVLDAQRPQVLTGISELATRGDLLDRAIILEQPTIDDTARRSEDEFWAAFEAVRPQILGALFDAVSTALANEASVELRQMPRMADPARWVTAAEPALGWRQGTFLAAYARNRREGHSLALEAALISAPLQTVAKAGDWQGTASDLLHRLAEIAGEDVTSQREWPKNPRALTEALKRLAPSLRTLGIDWRRLERAGNARPHSIRMVGGTTVTTDTTVTGNVNAGDGRTPDATVDRHTTPRTVTPDRARHDGYDGRDGPTPSPSLWGPDLDVLAPVLSDASADEEIATWTA